jgi:hypothetical protein
MSNEFHFVTHWRLNGSREEVAAVLNEPGELARWWPSAYLDSRMLKEGDSHGVGRLVGVVSKGWLPYVIRWRFTVTRNDAPDGFALRAEGEFRGVGVWTFTQDGEFVDTMYDWRITFEKPLLNRLTWLLRPAFGANHRWAMRKGEESLKLELARRRLPADRAARLPAPPGPTFAFLLRGAHARRT